MQTEVFMPDTAYGGSVAQKGRGRAAAVGYRLFFVLKPNIENADDVQLASLEVEALVGAKPKPVKDLASRVAETLPADIVSQVTLSDDAHLKGDIVAFEATPTSADLIVLAERLTYFQHVFGAVPRGTPTKHGCIRVIDSNGQVYFDATPVHIFLEMSGWYVRRAKTVAEVERSLTAAIDALLRDPANPSAREALAGERKRNEYLTHGFHKYKAKFFPRMARALTNYVAPARGDIVLDCFVGSGTTLVEAAVMNVPSIGVDIDPLCVFISETKAGRLTANPTTLERLSQRARTIPTDRGRTRQTRPVAKQMKGQLAKGTARLPQFIAKKLDDPTRREFEAETAAIIGFITEAEEEEGHDVAALCRLALSHALATKYSMRWVGTGEPRFALELNNQAITGLFANHLNLMARFLATLRVLERRGLLQVSRSLSVRRGDARSLPAEDGSIAGIVTSPPYLPASSGRETYTRSRAVALMALGLMTEEEIMATDRRVVGTMNPEEVKRPFDLPKEVEALVHFLKTEKDKQGRTRAFKSLPSEKYFFDMVESFKEMRRVLKPGGRAAVVVGKVHKFYKLTTKETLFEIDASRVLIELATNPDYGVGLKFDRVIDLKLTKQDYAARPKSTDDYFESIIILEKV